MNVPATPEIIEVKSLLNYLPAHVHFALERALGEFAYEDPERLKDEASMRYCFMSVLQHYGLPCPHPWRSALPHVSERSFECRMCRCWFIANEDLRRG